MKLGDIVHIMQPWTRLKISGENQVDSQGNRLWTATLTEAQKYAYWNRAVINHIIDEKTLTIYCIIKGD